jgi:predicted RNA-binding protein with EMAP domain
MVKPFVGTLATRMMRTSQVMQVHLTRIQYGFMPEKNIQEAEQLLEEMQTAIREIRDAISKPDPKPPSNYVPLK